VRLRVLILATLSVATLAAHPGAPSLWTIQARANGITGRIVLALQDLSGVRELDRNNDGVIDGPEAIGQISMLTRTLLRHFVLRSTNGPLAATVLRLRQPNATEIELFVRYDIPPEVTELEIESTFFEFTDIRHSTVCRLDVNGRVVSFLLDATNPARRMGTEPGRAIHPGRQLQWAFGGMFLLLTIRLVYNKVQSHADCSKRR